MTDLRQTTAGFMVAAPVDGRFYVLDDRQRLVLEFYKPAGRTVDIGLEPGMYEVRFEREPKALRARARDSGKGPHQTLDLAGFGPASLEFTRLRGVDTWPEYRAQRPAPGRRDVRHVERPRRERDPSAARRRRSRAPTSARAGWR